MKRWLLIKIDDFMAQIKDYLLKKREIKDYLIMFHKKEIEVNIILNSFY